MVLAELFAGYKHYVPIDAAALRQYRLFEPLGFFGVEAGSPQGAVRFLRTNTSMRVVGRLITAAGGEVLAGDDY